MLLLPFSLDLLFKEIRDIGEKIDDTARTRTHHPLVDSVRGDDGIRHVG